MEATTTGLAKDPTEISILSNISKEGESIVLELTLDFTRKLTPQP